MIKSIAPLLLSLLFVFASCGTTSEATSTSTSSSSATTDSKPSKPAKKEKEVMVLIETEFGNMKVKLYNETPQHRDNFVKLVEEGFYNDLIFHRVISNFMIQGGDPQSKNAEPGTPLGTGGPGYTIPAEFNSALIHKKGALAAARQGDGVNPEKASSGSQFYIAQGRTYNKQELDQIASRSGLTYTEEQLNAYATVGGTPHLDGGYTVFGEIAEGMEVIDKIAAVKKDSRDRPNSDIKMKMSITK